MQKGAFGVVAKSVCFCVYEFSGSRRHQAPASGLHSLTSYSNVHLWIILSFITETIITLKNKNSLFYHWPLSQFTPTNPSAQLHAAVELTTEHVAPFRHGSILWWHGATAKIQKQNQNSQVWKFFCYTNSGTNCHITQNLQRLKMSLNPCWNRVFSIVHVCFCCFCVYAPFL